MRTVILIQQTILEHGLVCQSNFSQNNKRLRGNSLNEIWWFEWEMPRPHTIAHTYTQTHTHTHTHTGFHSLTHIHVYTHAYMHVHTHSHTWLHTCSHTHAQTHMLSHTCSHRLRLTHTHKHKHAHTLYLDIWSLVGDSVFLCHGFECMQVFLSVCVSLHRGQAQRSTSSADLNLSTLFFYLFYLYEYTVMVFRHTRRGHQIPLQMVVSHHVVAGIWTQDLWKSNQCS